MYKNPLTFYTVVSHSIPTLPEPFSPFTFKYYYIFMFLSRTKNKGIFTQPSGKPYWNIALYVIIILIVVDPDIGQRADNTLK